MSVIKPTFANLKSDVRQRSAAGHYRPSLAGWIGICATTLFLLLTPFIERTWRTTGDEPHYLLTSHSLVADGDLDLTINYDQLDYLDFYFSKDIVRQVRYHVSGAEILDHYLGLPILIAPAYALAGRLGVLVFQALLGGLLASLTFKLAYLISEDRVAAAVGTIFVMLSPPLLMYHYLVYPELIAALLITGIIYLLLRYNAPSYNALFAVTVSLAILPWLNRRFVPLAVCLALLAVWAWQNRKPPRLQGLLRSPGWLGLATALISIGGLLWFNSQLAAPARLDVNISPDGGTLLLRLIRGIGWLMDQQRGLFIFAPIYIAAIFGLPYLGFRTRGWFVTVPFLGLFGITVLAGGFWIAWEVGPRFLVAGLPTLATVLALTWRTYGRYWLGALVILVLGIVSLINSWIIILNPELPYKSSLPLYYGEAISIPITDYLPDMGQWMTIYPSADTADMATVTTDAGNDVWFAEGGTPVSIIRSEPLHILPYGHYQLGTRLRTEPDLPPETELLRLSLQTLGGGQITSHVLTAADLPSDGTYGENLHTFLNTNVDRWRTPLVLHAVSSGQADLWLRDIAFRPDMWLAVGLPYGVLGALVLGSVVAWLMLRRKLDSAMTISSSHYSSPLQKEAGEADQALTPEAAPPSRTGPILIQFAFLSILPLAALAYLYTKHTQPMRVYDAADFNHFVGQPIADIDAADGQAWLVDPMTDMPQKAIYGPFDFFEPGLYQVTFRIKLADAVDSDRMLALLRVAATANFDELIAQPLTASHFTEVDHYHLFVLTVNNPRRQALSFEVNYTGEAALIIDEVLVERME